MKPAFRVSVIIPTYNSTRFLAEALESVFAQTHEPYEVIVVDDGSDDSPGDAVRAYPQVKLITLPNSGVSVARNTGVEAATGEFVAFLDADDFWAPRKLELQLALAEAEPSAGIVMSRQTYQFDCEIPSWFRGPRDGSPEAGFVPSNWLLRRQTWYIVGPFKAGMTHAEDADWLARASDAGVKTVMVNEPLVVHRIHGANASGQTAVVHTNVLQALRDSVRRKQQAGA